MRKPVINFIEKNIHGAWVIHGSIGYRQYYGYSKKESKQKYRDEAKRIELVNVR
jgi:hypothetical protein